MNGEERLTDFGEKQQIRKKPYIDSNISEIAKPGKYRIVGTITDVLTESFILQDESGQIEVFTESPTTDLNEEDVVRVLGRMEFEPERKFNAKIVQDLKNVSLEQYNQVREMEKSLRKKS